jgi:sugar/nucleoside kinase (ribokinase family)
VDLLTPVGQHLFSDYILEDIRSYGVHIIDPVSHQSVQPVFASIISSVQNGDRTIFSYHPELQIINACEINLKLNDYKLVLFDGFYTEISKHIAKECRANDILTVLDGGSWKPKLESLLVNIDIALCSNDFEPPDTKGPDAIFNYLHQNGVARCAITQGEKRILSSSFNRRSEIVIMPVEAIDTLGAGDVFHGAFCYYYVNGYNFTQSLQKAAFVAGESCKSVGVRQWMKDFSDNINIL